MRRVTAFVYGIATHLAFGVAVGAMAFSIGCGLQWGRGPFTGQAAWLVNLALVLQFPLLHSYFLTRHGRARLACLAPRSMRASLGTTLYAGFASLQLLVVFVGWSPSGIVWRIPQPIASGLWVAYGAAWLLLGKAMLDAGLGLQTGALGWTAVVRGRPPVYPGMPTRGLFRLWRQPIYTAFAAILLSAPTWSPDRLLLAVVWGGYCLWGPLLKERRFTAVFGRAFVDYRATRPYWLPISVRSRS